MAVELDPRLLEILACPSVDHAPLRVGTPDNPDAQALTCTACGRQYPVVDGVPVLLVDEAVMPPDGGIDTSDGGSDVRAMDGATSEP